jgi:hypothetical protein
MAMLINKDFLRRHESCANGYRWFSKKFPDGADIQTVLFALHAEGGSIFADWLIKKAGPQEIFYKAEQLNGHHVFFSGSIYIAGDINLTGCLLVGGDVYSEGDINACAAIIAGGEVVSRGAVNSRFIESMNINEPPNNSDAKFRALYGIDDDNR